jgi:cytochrome b
MIADVTLSFLVVLRIIWGVLGTKHAKFSGFALRPADLISYMSGIFSGSKRRWAGLNPATRSLNLFGIHLQLGENE